MIPSAEATVQNVGSITENVRMGIDQSAFAHIMSILTDLYSDPRLAVIREYSTNARDSHIDAGKSDVPIQVSLPAPNSRTPSFKVQDFGVGLNLDEIRDVYSQYGASTKRSSNDVNGMLGLGCKSGLTYAASFTITSVKDGQKIIAVITKDDDGIGAIKVLATIPADESNGVTIEIPVSPANAHPFQEAAVSFYAFWEPGTVAFTGKDEVFSDLGFWRKTKNGSKDIWVTPDTLASIKTGYYEQSYIIMGGVSYPHEFKIPGCTIKAWAPIGAVDFTPSREALHYTNRTHNTITRIQDEVSAKLTDRILEVASGGTEFEKNTALYQWGQYIPAVKQLRETVRTDPDRTFRLRHDSASKYKHPYVEWGQFLAQGQQVVTHYPFKSVGKSHKARLEERFGSLPEVLLLPETADISAIAGHPRMITWDEVVKTTQKPSVAYPKAKTVYQWWHNGKSGESDIVTGPVCWTLCYDNRYQEITQVVLRQQRQIERFMRLHPHAKPLELYAADARDKAKAALTDDDRRIMLVESGYVPGPFRDTAFTDRSNDIEDPLLREVIRLARTESATFQRARNLGVTIPVDGAVADSITKRYPLLINFPRFTTDKLVYDDLVLYLNAKYRATEPGKKEQ